MDPGYELRAIGAREVGAFLAATGEAFHWELEEAETALWEAVVEPERTLVVRAGGAIVATSALLSRRIAVPGAVLPLAAVSAVGVDPVHRGRGLLDGMMRGHLAAIQERGEEAVSALWASEAGIYQRWGFGLAGHVAELTVRSPEAHLRVAPDARPHAGTPRDLLAAMRAVHDAVLPQRPGMMARDARAWERVISDPEKQREGAGRLRALLAGGSDGPAGYALFAVRKQGDDGRPADVVELRELVAATPAAASVLWQHLLRLSLTRSVRWPDAPADAALPHLLRDSGAVDITLRDGLFVRLVDVSRALALRAYAAPVDLVLAVEDAVCPWNAGRLRLAADASGATCEPTSAPPDLELGATELGAAYLGGTSLAVLAAAGRVHEHTPGALAAASAAFKAPREPWCFEDF